MSAAQAFREKVTAGHVMNGKTSQPNRLIQNGDLAFVTIVTFVPGYTSPHARERAHRGMRHIFRHNRHTPPPLLLLTY